MAGELMDEIDTEFTLLYLDEAPRWNVGSSHAFRKHARELEKRGLAALGRNHWYLTDAGRAAVDRISDQTRTDFALAEMTAQR